MSQKSKCEIQSQSHDFTTLTPHIQICRKVDWIKWKLSKLSKNASETIYIRCCASMSYRTETDLNGKLCLFSLILFLC